MLVLVALGLPTVRRRSADFQPPAQAEWDFTGPHADVVTRIEPGDRKVKAEGEVRPRERLTPRQTLCYGLLKH